MRPKITNQAYMIGRPLHRPYATDTFYVPLANNILKMLEKNYLGNEILDKETLAQIARRVTWYFEDIVADLGIWRSFSEQCKKMYGYDVPIFHDSENYYADEPSHNAVSYIVWDTASELHNDLSIHPRTGRLAELTEVLYNILNSKFEQAPVNDEAKDDIKAIIEHSCKGFDELRESLAWILMGNYITRNFHYYDDERNAIKGLPNEAFGNLNESMKGYYVRTSNYFGYKTGPLALLSYQWLADLARVNGLEKEQKTLEGIEVLHPDTYMYKPKDDTWLHMEGLQGKEFDIRKKELNLPDKVFEENDGCVGQFIFFNGEWHLNGILTSHNFGEKFKKLKDANTAQQSNIMDTKKILEATGGKHLLYYKDVKEMIDDMKKRKLFPENQTFPFEDNPDCKLPCMFVNEDDKDNNMYFGFNFEENIKDPSNPYYDEKEAKEDGVTMLWEPQAPTEFVNYLINHDMLPDVADSEQFLQNSSAKDKKSDMLFMVRYTRRNKY